MGDKIWFRQSSRKKEKGKWLKEAVMSEKTFEKIFGGKNDDKRKKDKRDR